MNEKDMEDLIAAYPDDFFPRKKFVLVGRQKSFAGVGRFDLLFEDEFKSTILMELKARTLKYDDATQVAKYRDELKRNGLRNIVMWLVAPQIPSSVREFLDAEAAQVARQIRLLQSVLWWYVAPLFLGMALMVLGDAGTFLGKALAVLILFLVGWFIHWLNQYATPPSATNLNKVKLTDNVGAFWIADANTYEYVVRFNTATTNGKIWVNVSTFTSVEFWVSVTDTVNGQTKEYHSPAGTDAFNTVNIWDPYFFVYP